MTQLCVCDRFVCDNVLCDRVCGNSLLDRGVCVCVTQFPTELCDNVMPDRAACACVCVTMLYVAVCVCA